jgi:hypothetical protein
MHQMYASDAGAFTLAHGSSLVRDGPLIDDFELRSEATP